MDVEFDGGAVGLRSKKGNPTKKPWRVKTTSQRIVDAFKDKTCSCGHPHEICEGTETARSAMYPPQMTVLITQALYPAKCASQHAPAEHREVEQHLKHVSPLSVLRTSQSQ